MREADDMSGIKVVQVRNDSGSTIPMFGAVYITGTGADDDGNTFLIGTIPPTDNMTEVVFNGPWEIANGQTGTCFLSPISNVSFNTGDSDPVAGDIRGVKSNDWDLREGYTGFRVIGVDADARFGTVSVQSSGSSSVTSTKMCRIVTPVVLHSSGLCVKAYTQKWAGPADTDYQDDQEIWLELL